MAQVWEERRESWTVREPSFSSNSGSHAAAPIRWREILAVLLVVVLADVTVYRGPGFAGYALGFAVAPFLLALGMPCLRGRASAWIVGGMLLLAAAKLLWCGDALLVAVASVLLVAVAMTLAGRSPCLVDLFLLVVQTPAAGGLGLVQYPQTARKLPFRVSRGGWLGLLLPLAALVVFGTIFILANPDLMASVHDTLQRAFDAFCDWWVRWGPTWTEVLFWLAATWGVVGLLRPIVQRSLLDAFARSPQEGAEAAAESPLFWALRNMLGAVIVLFAVYLVFEFKTLWFRTFPPGFYYAGYAHEGAAWLTVALALATGLLSLVFRGEVLRDPRLPRLRRLAWVWSGENLLLALAVYHRLFIYIHFNGMTRMRTVGLIGMTAVVVGFVVVVWKIARQRDFAWLLRRQLWTLALAVYVLAALPVDTLVHRYNVARVLAGDLAPSVQISVHPISSEGILVLAPLLQCRDPIIREGIAALLAQRSLEQESAAPSPAAEWRSWQGAEHLLQTQLHALSPQLASYRDDAKRAAAWERFRSYAYQWY